MIALAKYYAHLSHMQNMLRPWTSNGLTSTTESGSGSILKSSMSNKLNPDRKVFPEMQILLIQRTNYKVTGISHTQNTTMSGRGFASGPAQGLCASLSPRPRPGAPLTYPQTLGSLASTLTLPSSLLLWSQKGKHNQMIMVDFIY